MTDITIMSIPFENKRFRINPIEIAVFAVVGLIFVKSGYNLLYPQAGFDARTLAEQAQDPLKSPLRDPASLPQASTFSEVTIGCDPSSITPVTTSAKIRLIGALCKPVAQTEDRSTDDSSTATSSSAPAAVPAATEEAAQDVKKISVVNTSARVAATVFPDYSNQRFSTDYITLNQGKNLIYVQYEFKDGKTLAQEFSVTKN